ncbi:MAG: glycosyltransferase family 4 protein [Patescibacteria group bacterium]
MKFNIISYGFLGNQQIYKTDIKQLVGGAEVYLYDLSKYLLSLGHRVKVIQSGEKNDEFIYDGIEVKTIKLPGICRKIGFIPENYYEFNWFWIKYLDKSVDRVHLHYLQHAWPFASKDMTATCHGIDWDIPKNEYIYYQKQVYPSPYKYLLRPFYYFNRFSNRKIFTKYGIKHLKKILSVDSSLLRYVQSEYPDFRKKINVIFNYVDVNIFKPLPIDPIFSEKFKGKFIILFPRNLSINRGVHYIIEAMKIVIKKYPEVLLLITGDGIAKKYILKIINDYNLSKNVILLGRLNHYSELPKYYNLADLVVIPTAYSEGTSLSCLEAMATGKPVIATNIGGLYDIINSGQNGLIVQPDYREIAQGIIKILDDGTLRLNLGNSALETIKGKFSKEIWEAKIKTFFEL